MPGLVAGEIALFTGVGLGWFAIPGVFHPGSEATQLGAVINAFWWFVCGLVSGVIIAVIYNYVVGEEKK